MKGHLIFSTIYDYIMLPQEKVFGFSKTRKRVTGKTKGTVLEIGVGTGLNLPHYKGIKKVIGIDPDKYMMRKAVKRSRHLKYKVELLRTRAEELPFEDDKFDSVLSTLTFCTIPEPEMAINEIRRVLKPSGTFSFFEHVRAEHPTLGFIQDKVEPGWMKLFGGCHPNRRILELFKNNGFEIIELKKFTKGILIEGIGIVNK